MKNYLLMFLVVAACCPVSAQYLVNSDGLSIAGDGALFVAPQKQAGAIVNSHGLTINGDGSVYVTGGSVNTYLVTGYGAKCDNSTDDTTAIQAAITAAGVAGGTVIIPIGICRISAPLTLACNACTLQGQGVAAAVATGSSILSTSASATIINMGSASTTFNSVRVRDLTIGRTLAGTGTSIGLDMVNCFVCDLTNFESQDSITGIRLGTGAKPNNQLKLERARVYATLGNITNGIVVAGQTNSLRIVDSVVAGLNGKLITNGLVFSNCGCADVWTNRFETNLAVTTGISVTGAVIDVHFVTSILDACLQTCILISSSTGGLLSTPNSIYIVDCLCNLAGTAGAGSDHGAVNITGSEGVHVLGGYYTVSGANGIAIATSSKIAVIGAHVANVTGNVVANGISLATTVDSVISNNTITGLDVSHALANGIILTSTSTGNTITGNVVDGFISSGLVFDATSTKNSVSGLNVNTTNALVAAVLDNGGNRYSASTLAANVFGDATSYKTTTVLTGPYPGKWDTGNANQIVSTTTSDTAAGIPVGVCPNTGITNFTSCLLMTSGTVPMVLGTGTCAIGQFVKVDTTTNGRILCSTYTAGTAIGTAQIANASVGTAANVAIGLR